MENLHHACEALELLQGWSIWLVGIQTAAVGFLGLLYRNGSTSSSSGFKNNEKIIVGFTIFFFGCSILFAMILSGGIPSAANHLLFTEKLADIPDKSIFAFKFPRTWITKLYHWGHLEASAFFLGMVCFGCSVWSYANNRN